VPTTPRTDTGSSRNHRESDGNSHRYMPSLDVPGRGNCYCCGNTTCPGNGRCCHTETGDTAFIPNGTDVQIKLALPGRFTSPVPDQTRPVPPVTSAAMGGASTSSRTSPTAGLWTGLHPGILVQPQEMPIVCPGHQEESARSGLRVPQSPATTRARSAPVCHRFEHSPGKSVLMSLHRQGFMNSGPETELL
jgi:hypothetical protein